MMPRQNPHFSFYTLWLLVGLLLVVTFLGARGLNADILFVDEYWSIYKSGGAPYGPASPSEIWHRLTVVDPGGMGGLYYYSLGLWESFLGGSPFAARLYSLMIGLLAVACTYRLGALMFTRRVGLYAALVLGTSAFFIDYLHEARAYTMFALFTVLSVWAYWELITRRVENISLWRYVALTLALVGLAYTHYVALSMAGVIGAYHLLFVRKDSRWFRITGAMIAAALLYLPWVSVLLEVVRRGTGDTNRHLTSMNAGQAIETLIFAFSNGSIAFFAFIALFAVTRRIRRKHDAVRFVWLWLIIALILTLTVNALVPFLVHARYMMVMFPALALIVALGIHELGRRGVSPALVVGVWVVFGVWQSFQPAFIQDMFGTIYRAPKAGLDEGLAFLRQHAAGADSDVALFHIAEPGFEPFHLFIMDYLMHDIPAHYDQIERMNNSFAVDDNTYFNDVLTALGDRRVVWTLRVPEIPVTQRTNVVEYVLQTRYASCGTLVQRDDLLMDVYTRLPQNIENRRGRSDAFFEWENGATLAMRVLRQSSADDVLFILSWMPDEFATEAMQTISAAVHILDEQGALVAQADFALTTEPFSCTAVTVPMSALPTGEYSAWGVVYDRVSGERLTINGEDRFKLVEFSR